MTDSYMADCTECEFQTTFTEKRYASTPQELAKKAARGHRSTGHEIDVVEVQDND